MAGRNGEAEVNQWDELVTKGARVLAALMAKPLFTARPVLIAAAAVGIGVASTPAHATEGAQPFSAPQDPASYDRALQCLTQAIYYEARSETEDGQRAVAQVVLNRVRHPNYPNTVCGVVFQGSHRRTGCQFSFTCDGSLGPITEAGAWARAQRLAAAALRGYVYRPAGLSLNYHTTAIRPYWAPSLVRHAVIGAHIFYRQPGSGSLAAFSQAPSDFEPRTGSTGVVAVSRAPHVARLSREFLPARVEVARIERPQFERAVVERPPGFGRPVRRQAAAAPRQAPREARAVPARVGPRTTIEAGVRVARGS